jgi:LPXTG-site transpeptidase (sortase) family protein
MTGCRHGPHYLVTLALISLLLLMGGSCTFQSVDPEKETAIAQLLTVQPEIALTLTAWPTPPPIITPFPAFTASPRPLWTASPQPTTAQSPTPPPFTEPAETAEAGATTTFSLGSKPAAERFLIPRLGLDVPVVEVSWNVVFEAGTWQSVWQTADGAAGHHRNSANPGEAGNVVVSGHHNTQGEIFREVSEIGQPGAAFGTGDEIILVAQDGQQYTYIVVQWERFQEEGMSVEERQAHARFLLPTTDATLTLVTCWPYESNSHRVVIVAKLQP